MLEKVGGIVPPIGDAIVVCSDRSRLSGQNEVEDGFSESLAMRLMVSEESGSQFPVDLDDAWRWLGYSTKQKCLQRLKKNCEEGLDYWLNQLVKSGNDAGSSPDKYFLTIECFKHLSMMAGTEKGKKVRHYFVECERRAKAANKTIAQLLQEIEDLKNGKQQRALPETTRKLMEAGDDVVRLDRVLRDRCPDLASNQIPPELRQRQLIEFKSVEHCPRREPFHQKNGLETPSF